MQVHPKTMKTASIQEDRLVATVEQELKTSVKESLFSYYHFTRI